MSNLAALAPDRTPIPAGTKGFAGVRDGATAAELTGTGLHDGVLSLPVLSVRDSAVAHNIACLARFCKDSDVDLLPHAKTTMAPALFMRQLQAGALGLTAATVSHAQVYRACGVDTILIANQVVDSAGLAWMWRETAQHPSLSLSCFADSREGVALLGSGSGSAAEAQLGVFVELGHAGGRAGCRDIDDAVAVARDVVRAPGLWLRGVAGWEGGLSGRDAVERYCARLVMLLARLREAGLLDDRAILTAGGSTYPDTVTTALSGHGARVWLRSGAYLTHDDGLYAARSPFTGDSAYALRSALELWAPVLSRPEPALAVLGAGRRDVGTDQGPPRPLRVRRRGPAVLDASPGVTAGWAVIGLNDQHAFLQLPTDADLRPGDAVSLAVSHPCTTIDRWTHLPLLDDDDRIVGVIRTHF